MPVDLEEIWVKVRDYPNVIGYAPEIKNRLVRGKERLKRSFRVFVAQKIPIDQLDPDDVIPKTVNGVPIDVVDFSKHFQKDLRLPGEFMIVEELYVGESCFLFH